MDGFVRWECRGGRSAGVAEASAFGNAVVRVKERPLGALLLKRGGIPSERTRERWSGSVARTSVSSEQLISVREERPVWR
jgi:hypothetical protein